MTAIAAPTTALPSSIDDFWHLADDTRLAAEFEADTNLLFLKAAPFETVKNICFHYRFFNQYYAQDLAYLVYKLQPGRFKSLLASILAEEFGNGDERQAHLQLYDNFLASIGFENDAAKLDAMSDPRIIEILEELHDLTVTQSTAYVIGLRGMGAECLCQVYLTQMVRNLRANPALTPWLDTIDWQFFDLHAGDVDIEHRLSVRSVINDYLTANPERVEALASGYLKGKSAWDTFWGIVYNDYQQTNKI